ncbi:hypothetical protein IDJ77_11335 [Mucilaginibacter sp. ZT4R22]|uniref:HTH cro/C1-type domain-containing protein n=1 Tax=Mucilaginibacter pankratovii TaxID=2772110 RepID=A0ABR7WSA7_9SPHI|nr:hypothetical protein [Mucilaginibacter pankratovii]MBD1364402.1 hypothetical protein [Mucilaginibacter pankratovii]
MPELKYNIKNRLLRLSGDYQTNRYRMCIAVGINDKTLVRWLKTDRRSKFSIPSDQFYKIAEFLSCNPNELLTNEPAQVTH